MFQLLHTAERQIERLNSTEWFFVLAGVILIGLFCLRGFGSRSNY